MEKMKELYGKVAKDNGLQAKFAEIINGAENAGEEATKEKLVAFAKEAGYEVSFDEAQEFFKALSEKKEGILSDEELDAVAGGKMFPGPGPGPGPGPTMLSVGTVVNPCQSTSLFIGAPKGCFIF